MPETRPFDLQAALDAAKPGDVIYVPAGVALVGTLTLRPRHGRGWITVVGQKPAP